MATRSKRPTLQASSDAEARCPDIVDLLAILLRERCEALQRHRLHAIGHARWIFLWGGMLTLLEHEAPQAHQRLMVALEHHGLAGPAMHFPPGGRYSETRRAMASGTVDDLNRLAEAMTELGQGWVPLVENLLARVRSFAEKPSAGSRQGKERVKTATDRELLLAYEAARWNLQHAGVGRARIPGEALSELAKKAVAQWYGLKVDSVDKFLRKARRHNRVPIATRKLISLAAASPGGSAKVFGNAATPARLAGLKKQP